MYPQGLDGFWTRREGHRLHPVDALGYAALHLTRHLLRGNLRPFHVWELAYFLHQQHEEAFWQDWKEWHSPSLRRLEAVAFLLARTVVRLQSSVGSGGGGSGAPGIHPAMVRSLRLGALRRIVPAE